jgi:predicted nuclease with TOPRIM domain
MFNSWKEANKQVMKAQEYERELHSQNSQLEKEVQRLRGELQGLRTGLR